MNDLYRGLESVFYLALSAGRAAARGKDQTSLHLQSSDCSLAGVRYRAMRMIL